ncbi:hypothetical protein B7463_g11051, partial [Scytalidium lignicola]
MSQPLAAEAPHPVSETTALLVNHDGSLRGDDDSSATLTEGGGRYGNEEDSRTNDGAANQQVSGLRGLLIALSLWGLIFLQGEFILSPLRCLDILWKSGMTSNISMITTTQSDITADLDAFASANWFTSAYLIATASLAPLTGRLAQIFSPRSCIFVSSLFFSLGAIITSQARSLHVFLLGRATSGVGGAGIMTISLILVLELSERKKRGLFVGLVNTGFTSGVSLGAVIAGALVQLTGWRFLFWIQSPLAIMAGIGIFFSIPKSFTSGPKSSTDRPLTAKLAGIDYLGAISLTASIVLFLYGLSSQKILWIPIVSSGVTLTIFILNENFIAHDPVIPVSILKSRGALLSCLATLGSMSARWMVLFYSPVYAISVLGWSPASAGSILIPTNLGFAFGGLLAGLLHIKRDGSFWSGCVIALTAFSATLFLISRIASPSLSPLLFILSVFLNGISIGAALNYTLAHLLHLSPPGTSFISTSLLATFRGFAGSFGSAIGGGLFVRMLKGGLEDGFKQHGGLDGKEDLVRRLLGSPALVQGLEGVEKTIAVNAYAGSVRGIFLAGSALGLVMVFVQAGTGWTSGEGEKEDVATSDAGSSEGGNNV